MLQHKEICNGDVRNSQCEYVACGKRLYLDFILPGKKLENRSSTNLASVPRRGRPKGSANKPKTFQQELESSNGTTNGSRYPLREKAVQSVKKTVAQLHNLTNALHGGENSCTKKDKRRKVSTAGDSMKPANSTPMHQEPNTFQNENKLDVPSEMQADNIPPTARVILLVTQSTNSKSIAPSNERTVPAIDPYPMEDCKRLTVREETKAYKNDNFHVKRGRPRKSSCSENPVNQRGTITCTTCGFETKYEGMMNRHKKHAHNNGQLFQCNICNKSFQHQCKYKQHLGVHQRWQCDFCNKTYTRKHDRDKHVENSHSDKAKSLVCGICSFTCRYEYALREHEEKHSGYMLKCSMESCEFKTSQHRKLTNHIDMVHKGSKEDTSGEIVENVSTYTIYNCAECSQTCTDMESMEEHLKAHDKPRTDKLYFCDICDYSSPCSTSFRNHMLDRHITLAEWSCANCKYSAVTQLDIQNHIDTHHNGASEAFKRTLDVRFNMEAYCKRTEAENEVDQCAVESNSAPKYLIVDQDYSEENICTEDLQMQNQEGAKLTELNYSDDETHKSDTIYSCGICGLTDYSLSNVQQHIAISHGNDDDFNTSTDLQELEVTVEACEETND